MMVRRAVAGVLVLLGFVLGVFPPRVEANWVGQLSGDCYYSFVTNCRMNDRFLGWDAELGPLMTTATFDTLYNSYHTTDIDVNVVGATNNGAEATSADIFYRNGSLGGDYGLTSCQSWSGHVCQHNHVIYDASALAGNTTVLKSLACHETGHAVGLTHPGSVGAPDDPSIYHCMVESGWAPNVGTHNVNHINTNF